MANTDFGILLKTLLDKSGINSELEQVQKIVNKYSIDIMPELKTTSLKNQMKAISQEIANDFNKAFGTNLTGNDVFKAYENQAKQAEKAISDAQKKRLAEQEKYYNRIINNNKKIYDLKEKKLSADKEESKELQRQITNLEKKNKRAYDSISKKGLGDTDWGLEVSASERELKNRFAIKESRLQDKANAQEQANIEKQIAEYNKQELEYQKKRKQYEAEGIKQAQDEELLRQSMEYYEQEKYYQETRAKYLAEGKAQEEAYNAEVKETTEYYKQMAKEAEKAYEARQKLEQANIEKANEIRFSFDNGQGDSDYQNRIIAITNELEKYGLSADEAKVKTQGLRDILDGFKVNGNFLPDNQLVAQADKLEAEFKAVKVSLDSAKLSYDKFLQPVSSEKASSLIIRINDFLSKNTAITKEAKEELQGFIRLLQNGNVNLSDWNKFDTRLKEINIEMRETGKLGKSLKQTLLDGAKSFAQWTFSSGMVMEVVQTVKTLTNNVTELDNKLLELVKVSDLTADGLEKATERAYKLGDTVGKTGTQVIGAVTEFKRAGYNMEKSFDMAEAALVMTNVAEGITETSDAAGTLISVLKGFNMADSEAMSIVDMINATSNASPIGFDQLAEGLERTAGTLAQSGNTIQQTIGLLTAGYAQLRNVEKVSQGLITISARIRGVGEDGETIDGLSSKMSEDFGKIGVAVENADGSLRSVYQIAQDYSKVLPTLTDKQKQYYAELAAGKHQVTVWNSIVKQFKDAENATTQAINSVGSASEENQKYLDSISGKISIFNSSVEDLSNTLLNSDLLKFFVDLGTIGVKAVDGLINSFNFLGGSLGTITTIGSGILGAMGHGLTNYVTQS